MMLYLEDLDTNQMDSQECRLGGLETSILALPMDYPTVETMFYMEVLEMTLL